jgi:hypothetical protein
MKNIRILGFCILCLYGIISISYAQDGLWEPATVRMGAARVNITPEEPVPMTGYASRTEPFTAVHDSLFATALYFESPDNSLLLITADLIGYSSQFIDETRKKISEEIGMEPENILISAVHNHGAPVSKAYERDVPLTVENYVLDLQKKFIAISVRASESLTPVKIGTGKGHCELNINRRAEFADGGIWLGRASDKPCDHEVSVTRFDDLENRTLAVLINWPSAWEIFGKIQTFPVETLEALSSILVLPGKKRGEDRFPQEVYEPGPDVEISLTAFRIGHLVLAGISGELMNEIGMEIKKQSPFSNTVIMTHCNGSSGYICTDKAFSEGGYEIQVTRLMPGAEGAVSSELLQMFHKM